MNTFHKRVAFRLCCGFLAFLILSIVNTRHARASISSIMIEADTGRVLSANNADELRYPASLTKVMTLYITFDALEKGLIKLEDDLPVSRKAANRSPSRLGLRPGSKISVKTAIEALIIRSANDCATVLAEGLGYSEENFAKAMTQTAKALGMKVLAYDLYPNDSGRAIADYVSLDELYAKSDVISLHCNLTPENTCMINKDSIAKMKDGVILINNARGQLINEQDVAEALNSGKMGAAGLDVVYTEPIREDNPLLKAKNCIITPHISWAPKESRQRIMDCAVENAKAYIAGSPINVVNK